MKMTKQRKQMIERIKDANDRGVALCFGFTDRGAEEYFFSDGGDVRQDMVERMIEAGLLRKSESLLGTGQELELSL